MGEPELKRMTADEFLVWQQSQDQNYELVDGLPVLPLKSMTGASHSHDQVVINLIREFATQLRRKPCKPTTDDIALRIPAGNVRRPDLMVECGEVDPKGAAAVEPRLAVEVLSRSTMGTDRIRKVEEYKTIPSLAYILLVDTERPQITFYERAEEGWTVRFIDELDAAIELPEIECRLLTRDIFEGLPFAG
ncbi:Uma2 family endonuclease [Chelatococcus sambhunathii]|uniref:Uma2 family endonuclease n=1 Tax=Chelatococcus sambhunathii TaxID=363953 RepID=A0ABU1DG91_9HYPH|nr:Uma2 family endonuclease [Chelatococcus sambhunathii]MDR4307127.1 Uma2 family endonuclease [Chelatococcus sambhunathii]